MSLPNNTSSRSFPIGSGVGGTDGFTLLELLISLFIVAIIFTVLTVSFRTTLHTIDTIEERREAFRSGRLAFSLLVDELQSTASPSFSQGSQLIGVHETRRNVSLDRMVFDSFNYRRYPGGRSGTDLAQFTLWVHQDQLLQQETPRLTGQSSSAFSALQATRDADIEFDFSSGMYPLANAVKEFRLRYHDGSQWVDQWSTHTLLQLPFAVSLAMTLKLPDGGTQTFSTFVGLPRDRQNRIQ